MGCGIVGEGYFVVMEKPQGNVWAILDAVLAVVFVPAAADGNLEVVAACGKLAGEDVFAVASRLE